MHQFKSVFIGLLLSFISIYGFGQSMDCNHDRVRVRYYSRDYNLDSQKLDFTLLQNTTSLADSLRILRRLMSFNDTNEIGEQVAMIRYELSKTYFKQYVGVWKFEWSGSNWGTDSIDSAHVEDKIIIADDKITWIRNGKKLGQPSKISCLDVDFFNHLYFTIQLDSIYFRFYIKSDLNQNFHAAIHVKETSKHQNKYLYLIEPFVACGAIEMYYSKLDTK